MADYNLGTARGVIELTYKDDGTKAASGGLRGVGDSATLGGKAVSLLEKGVAVAGAGIVAGFAVAVNSAANFSSKMSEIKAVSGGTADQMSAVSAKALQLGKDTVFSAGGAADAMIELAKAGVPLPDILNGAADATVALAAAGGVDLPEAATIASNAMNEFGLTAGQMPHIADLIAGAANASAISVSDFGEALAYVGPVAKTAGVSISDTATAIAILGNQGIKGSSAGTALRSIISQLSPTTKIATAQFKQLGLITKDGTNVFYTATGALKPMNEVIGLLHDKTKNLSAQQKITFSKKAFGLEDLAAVSILSGQTGASFDVMTAAIAKTKAADVAKTKMDNLKGSVEQLKGSAETLAITAGLALQPALKGAADSANGMVGGLIVAAGHIPDLIVNVEALAKKFGEYAIHIAKVLDLQGTLSGVIQTVTSVVSILWQVFQQLLPTLKVIATIVGVALVVAFRAASAIMQAIGAVLNFVSNHLVAVERVLLGLVAVASPALIIMGGLFIWLGIQSVISAAKQVAAWATSSAGSVKSAATMLLNSYKMVGSWIAMGAQAVASAAMVVWGWVTSGAAAIASAIRTAAAWAMQTAAAIAGKIVQIASLVLMAAQWLIAGAVALLGAAQVALAWLIALGPIAIVIAVIVALGILIATHFQQFLAIITAVWNAIKDATVAVWNAVVDFITTVFTAIWDFVSGWIDTFLAGITALWNGIKDVTSAVWNAIKTAITAVWNAIVWFVTTEVNGVKDIISAVWNAIKSVTSSVWNAISGAVSAVMNAISSVVSSVTGAVKGAITGAWNAVSSATSSIWNGLKSIVTGAINSVMDAINGIKSKVTGAFSGAIGWLLGVGGDIIRGLVNGITNMAGAAADAAKSVVSGAINGAKHLLHLGSPSKVFVEMGVNTVQGYVKGMDDTRNSAVLSTARLVNAVVKASQFAKLTAGQAAAMASPMAAAAPTPIPAGWTANASTPAKAPVVNLEARVFVGDTELKDIVGTEVGATLAPLSRITQSGGF
jgi:TP901 family phage tail tape measure protein